MHRETKTLEIGEKLDAIAGIVATLDDAAMDSLMDKLDGNTDGSLPSDVRREACNNAV